MLLYQGKGAGKPVQRPCWNATSPGGCPGLFQEAGTHLELPLAILEMLQQPPLFWLFSAVEQLLGGPVVFERYSSSEAILSSSVGRSQNTRGVKPFLRQYGSIKMRIWPTTESFA